MTAKHKTLTLLTQKSPKISNAFMCCICNKQYKSRVGLWKHSKKCSMDYSNSNHNAANSENERPDMNTFMQLIQQNSDFKELIVQQNQTILELAKKDTNTNNNNNTTNNNQSEYTTKVCLIQIRTAS